MRPPPGALAEVATAVEPVRVRRPDLRWATAEQWHLTLAFLGEVDGEQTAELGERLCRAARRHRPMRLQLAGAGRFGGRVLWLGVDGDLQQLGRLADSVAAAARRTGLGVEDRRYHPHVTLARAREPGDLRAAVDSLAGFAGRSWPTEEFTLVQSRLGAGAGRRPDYVRVAGWRLG